jgi:hypothetical protein
VSSQGRPGSALLILVGIFATAAIFRVPLQRPTESPRAARLDATSLAVWSPARVAAMTRPVQRHAIAQPIRENEPVTDRVAPLEVMHLASAAELSRSVPAHRPPVGNVPPIAVPPVLASSANVPVATFAASIAPADLSTPSSAPQPFSALGTAFAKTGAALTLAFKKTGQGILAPF